MGELKYKSIFPGVTICCYNIIFNLNTFCFGTRENEIEASAN